MSELHELQERYRLATDRVRQAILIDDDMEDYEDALAEQDALADLIQEEMDGEEVDCDERRIDTSGDQE
ncbi:MAG: hypothetical protein IJH78_06675 [Clostridia bacterium]|nr:hypothetical protein [Clostridia bacterium]